MREVQFALGDQILSAPLSEEEFEVHQCQVRERAARLAELYPATRPVPEDPDYSAVVTIFCIAMCVCTGIGLLIGWYFPH